MSLRTETAYKANGPGKVAQHTEAPGSGSGVNAEVVQLQFAFLSGETSIPIATGNRRVEGGGVSRGHSTAQPKAGRPEPVGCSSTPEPRPSTQTSYERVEGTEASEGKHGGTQANLLGNSGLSFTTVPRTVTTGTARCGPARRVVWEGGANHSPRPD